MQKFDEFIDEYLNEQDETVRSEYEKAKEDLLKHIINNALEQYQFALNQLLNRIDQQLIELNDDELTYYFKQVKQHIVERPSIESKYLEFYSRIFTKEYEFLSDGATPDNIETVINIIASVSGKIKSLTMFNNYNLVPEPPIE